MNGAIEKTKMDSLVMNLFLYEGFLEAAEKFQMESRFEADLSDQRFLDRVAVIKAIRARKLDEAIEKLNGINPELVETSFHLRQQQLIELIHQGKTEEALAFSRDVLAPFAENNVAFQQELEKTAALFLFEDLSTCPYEELLDHSQWFKTAREVNAAILRSENETGGKGPKPQRLLKKLTWSQKQLDERGYEYPRMRDLSTGQLTYPPE